MKNNDAHSLTLADAYMRWLEAPHLRRPGLTNAERSASDRLNHQRALACLAAGHHGDAWALEAVPAGALREPDMTLVSKVALGAEVLNAQRRRTPSSEKTIKNLVACCRAVRDAVSGEDGAPARTLTPNQLLNGRPKRRIRARFPRERWPQRIATEWQGYAVWKTKPVLAPNEGAHLRRRRCKPNSIEAHARRVTPLIRYLVEELGMTAIGLVDLADINRYAAFVDWYFNEDADGGYHAAADTATTLATISQYLVAKGELEQTGPGGLETWNAFYRAGRQVRLAGSELGYLSERRQPDAWTPNAMHAVAHKALHEPAPRYWRGDGTRRQRQVLARKRYGLFFGIAVETPLRARNFQEMRWNHNLKRTPDGRWQVRFVGRELKVATRRDGTNIYERTYSQEGSELIDLWRDTLRGYFGDDFERTHPYVFASEYKADQPISHQAFLRGVEALAIECHGHAFKPHDARRVVATHLINRYNLEGAYMAAELLGDTIQVVLKEYYRGNTAAGIHRYLEDLDRAAA